MWALIALAAILGPLLPAGIYAYWVEPRWLRVRRRVLHLSGWNPALDGLTILQISDLHVHPGPTPVDGFLRLARGIEADVVVITGDFIAGPRSLDHCRALLRPLAQERPVYGILGNHEHVLYGFNWPWNKTWKIKERLDTPGIARALQEAGVRLIINSTAEIPWNGGVLRLAGVDDLYNHAMDLDAALAGGAGMGSTVLLCHSPEVLDEAAARGIPLILSGHTHGGQVRFPPFGTPTTGTKKPIKPACGVIRKGGSVLHISPGLGLSFPPVRFFSRPELTLLELRREQKAAD